jgi:hypothetical protein
LKGKKERKKFHNKITTNEKEKLTRTLHVELLMKYPYHSAHHQHRNTTDCFHIIGGWTENRQIVVYVGTRVDALVLMFGGEVDVDDGFGDTSGSWDDKIESSRNFFMHVNDGETRFLAEWNRQILLCGKMSILIMILNNFDSKLTVTLYANTSLPYWFPGV